MFGRFASMCSVCLAVFWGGSIAPIALAQTGSRLLSITVAPRTQIDRAIEAPHFIFLDGPIDPDAPRRLQQVLDQLGGGAAYVVLNSPGGSMVAGMELGRILRTVEASTTVGSVGAEPYRPKPGRCFSACSLVYLGGKFRYFVTDSVFGVHRASMPIGPRPTDLDAGQIISAAISRYLTEMGIDQGLLGLMMKTSADQIYQLSKAEMAKLGLINNGRLLPQWSIEAVDGGMYLRGSQETVYGTGKALFICNKGRFALNSFYTAGERGESIARGGWAHSLLVDNDTVAVGEPLAVRNREGMLSVLLPLSAENLQRIRTATSVGHAMQVSREAPTFIGYKVEIDESSQPKVRAYLGNCLADKH